ncbi:MAG: DUF2934 domain-containing protein [Alphaproteobacteria bacterium]|jgi:hypothetical protein|nr:DUF2934 domain-containing protein [Alphaproteobacteria bacterium]
MRHDPLATAIRERARELWEAEGRPAGRALDHWLRAEREVRADAETAIGGLRVPMRRPEFDGEASAGAPTRRG